MKTTEFRNWLRQIWQENCRERDEFGEPSLPMQAYFQRYKYWLKREFRFQNQRLSKP